MRFGLKVYIAIFMLFLYAPTLLLPVFALNDSSTVAFPLSGLTFKWFAVLRDSASLHSAILNSLFIAVTTAVMATVLGILTARASARYRFPGRGPIMGFIMIPMALPEIIIGVSLLVVILQMGFDLSLWAIIAGHVLICTPFAIAILRSAFQRLDPSMEEASLDLGHSRFMTFINITLPLIMPAVISSLLISFTISLDEFVIAFFLSGTEPTLPVYIWSQLRFPRKIPSVIALGTVLLLLSLSILILAEYIRRRGAKKSGIEDQGGMW